MKQTIKIILLLICISVIISNIGVYAWGLNNVTGTDPSPDVKTSIKDAGENTLGVISAVGVVLSVVVLIIIGMKYMLGSVEEKAQYKKTLMPYVIGAAIVFSGSVIPEIIYELVKNIK